MAGTSESEIHDTLQEQKRFTIAKVAQASGQAVLPDHLRCDVMPAEGGRYRVTLWHCDAVYEDIFVSEDRLLDMRAVLSEMHFRQELLK